MRHGQYKSGKTVRYKTDNPRHENVQPYRRQKNKKDFSDYEDW